VQSSSAGVERYLAVPELLEDERIVLTNMRGVHGATIADHVFAMLLALTRDLPYYLDPAQRGTWNRNGSGAERIALRGRTLLVVGLGGIGSEVARRGKGFGMRVLATRRRSTPPPPYVDHQGTPDELPELLRQSDVVVLSVPLTDETEGMIGQGELANVKPGAYLVNVARGRVVDTEALVRALEDGHLAGACLDVTDPEPLPPGHPLWAMPNVIITPHVSGRSALTGEQWQALYLENLRRFGAGEPLLNVVDKKAGY
jgi:phosphoglycerate dehydrogenase-like enzyme